MKRKARRRLTLSNEQRQRRAEARAEATEAAMDRRPITVGELKQILDPIFGLLAEQTLRTSYIMRSLPMTRVQHAAASSIIIPGQPANQEVTRTLMQWYRIEREAFRALLEAEDAQVRERQAAEAETRRTQQIFRGEDQPGPHGFVAPDDQPD